MASDDPFITPADLTEYLGRDVTADAGAVMACDAACQIVRGLADQLFNQVVGDVVVMDGTGTDCLLLPEVPATAAGTVTVDGGLLVSGTDYVLADQRRLLRLSGVGGGGVWPLGRQNVAVTYDHGYGGTVPSDVRMVALQVAERIAVQGIATSETVAGQSITYASPALDLTAGEKLILQRHRAH